MGTGSLRIAQLVTGVGVIPRAILTREPGLFQEHLLPTGPAESGLWVGALDFTSGNMSSVAWLIPRVGTRGGPRGGPGPCMRPQGRKARARTGPQASCLSGAEGLSSGRAGMTFLKPWAGGTHQPLWVPGHILSVALPTELSQLPHWPLVGWEGPHR